MTTTSENILKAQEIANSIAGASLMDDLRDAVHDCQVSMSALSAILARLDLSAIPFCDRDLNEAPIGDKLRFAKQLIAMVETLTN